MPSSTSSSDQRRPTGGWGPTWLLAGALCAAPLALWEGTLRNLGFQPIVRDDPRTWLAARHAASTAEVVLLGTSRIQTAIDPGVWAESWPQPGTPVQLAVAGGSPLSVLESLAADPEFDGLAVVEVLPQMLFDIVEGDTESRAMLRAWRGRWRQPAELLESHLQMAVSGSLALRSLPTRNLVHRAFRRANHPAPPYYTMDRRRFLQLDFSRTALDRHNEQILERIRTAGAPANDSQRERLLERLAAASAAIAARGGRVLLVHFPHGGEVREIEERRYPPASYWDAVVSAAIAPTLDLRDDARIGALALPDGSHVDQRDAPAFTRLFVSRLRELLLSRSTAPGPVPERQAPQDGPERRAPAEQGVNGEHQGQPKIPSAGSWSDPTELFGHGPTGSWDAILWGGFAATAIARDGSILLYYQGSSSYDERLESVVSRAIGVATSTDGRHFVKHPLNPVLTWSPTRSPEEGAASAAVLAEPDGETTLYFGANTAISRRLVTADGRCATSRDGMTFSLCEGVVLDHADRGLWASGDELFPVIALDRGGRRIVYYLPNGRLHRRHLGVAWGTSRTRLDASAAVTSAGRPVSSWGPGGWAPLSAESYALFLSVEPDRHAAREHVDVYVASAASPAEVSGPVEAYAFDDLSRGTVLLDVERATWFLYYRNRDGSGYRVRTAPLELTASTRAPARPAPAPAPAP